MENGTSQITDLFKFMAVRPPAAVAASIETSGYLVRDPNVATAAGLREVVNLGSRLAAKGVAEQLASQHITDRFEQLRRGWTQLRARYQRLATSADPVPSGETLLQELDVDLGSLNTVEQKCWIQLYAGFALGNSTGDLTSDPYRSLQLIHFLKSLDQQNTPEPAQALRLLDSTVTISPKFIEGLNDSSLKQRKEEEEEKNRAEANSTPEQRGRTNALTELAHHVVAVRGLMRLLDVLTTDVRYGVAW